MSDFWASYREKCVPVDACDVQVMETRRAFYAGMAQILSVFMGEIGDMEEEAGMARISDLWDELGEYLEEVVSNAEGR